MPYLGVAPNPRENREVDDISGSFNGSTTAFTLQSGGSNVSPGKDTAIIVSLGGVVQNPGTDYTIAASTITFTTAPASGLTFFGVVLAQSIDIETVADNTVTTAKIVDGAVTNAKVNASAAIAGTKISPDFGSQNVVTTGSASIGIASPDSKLHVFAGSAGSISAAGSAVITLEKNADTALQFLSPSSNIQEIRFGDESDNGSGYIQYSHASNFLSFGLNGGSEKLRINSSGRLLIGSTVESSHGGIDSALQVIGTGTDDSSITMSRFSNDVHSAYLVFSKSRNGSIGGNTVVQSGDSIGRMTFFGNDGTDGSTPAAEIDVEVDGTPGSNDMPGRIVFRTTADGASSTTERMRITSSGRVLIGLTSSGGDVQYLETNQPQASGNACAMFQSSTSSSLSQTHALRIQGHGFNSAFQMWEVFHIIKTPQVITQVLTTD